MGAIIRENTALGASTTTDAQLFCYDDQNRLVWAGAIGTSPCNGAVSSGTLTSAYYSQAYTYDAQGRLTSGAIGSAVYGDSSHPHAVTSIGGGAYTASYDAVGDMTCRAPNSSVTCSGAPTGAIMTYDAERRLSSWQNTPPSLRGRVWTLACIAVHDARQPVARTARIPHTYHESGRRDAEPLWRD